ncbi:sulfotransferase 6B1-like [Lissotriton helveticus]
MAGRGKPIKQIEKLAFAAAEKRPEELLFTYKGVLYPSIMCSPETFKALETFQMREGDLLAVSYPKCGTNWIYQLLNDMVYSIAGKEPPQEIPVLEFGTPDKLERLSKLQSPRVFITHLHNDNLPETVFANKIKTLVVFRNPKDAAVSYFHFQNNNPALSNFDSWDQFFECFISGKVGYGSYFDHAIAWNKRIDDENVMVVMFEDMKKDLVAATTQIADFFGIRLTKEQIQLIAEKGSFKAMKDKSDETHGRLGSILFRKGDIGDWKNHLSESQSQEMDAKFEECLAGTKLGEKMSYNVYCKA